MTPEKLRRILVVEDDDSFRETVRDLLREEGYEVREARDVRKATKRLNNHVFDLVLTDFNLGDATGAQVIEIASAVNPVIKLVIMSGNLPLAAKAANDGIRFLAKPFGMRELLALITELLDSPAE